MSKYKERITLLFKEDEELDEVILYVLNELAPKSNRPFKIKEMLKEYIKENKRELYNQALEHLEHVKYAKEHKMMDNNCNGIITQSNDNQLEILEEKLNNINIPSEESKKESNDDSHEIVKNNDTLEKDIESKRKDDLKTKARQWL